MPPLTPSAVDLAAVARERYHHPEPSVRRQMEVLRLKHIRASRSSDWLYRRRMFRGGIFSFSGHTRLVYSVNFSPDGTRLATASVDGTAWLWDAHTGRELGDKPDFPLAVRAPSVSADGKRLASIRGGALHLIDLTVPAGQDLAARLWATRRDPSRHADDPQRRRHAVAVEMHRQGRPVG